MFPWINSELFICPLMFHLYKLTILLCHPMLGTNLMNEKLQYFEVKTY
jgi:hypothetical protein